MIYQFGDCSLDCQRQELMRAGAPVAVEPQVLRLIAHLIENRDRVVPKGELFAEIWKGRIVSDGTLNTRIAAARAALGDDGGVQSVIKTFSRRGFRFVAEVAEIDAMSTCSSAEVKPAPDKPSVAVMPLKNLSGDPEQEYFADGIAEDLITSLSRIRHLLVTARNTTFAYKGQVVDVPAVASALGVRYVLEGSVRKSGNRVRFTVQLIDGETGNHIWAERYDRDLEDIFAVQDEITQIVIGALQPELTRSEIERARRKPPESLDAWDLYQRGLWHENRITRADNAKAIELFSKAISLDPEFARPYAGLSECYTYDVFYAYAKRDPNDIFTPARKAVEIDPQDGNAHRALG